MRLALTVETKIWPMAEPFGISRGFQTEQPTVLVKLNDQDGRKGRGEGCGVPYAGETPASMTVDIERVRRRIEAGLTREELRKELPPGGARCAIDSALWDLEAKGTGSSAFAMAGIDRANPVTTAFTIGMRSIDAYETTARAHSCYALLKVKVGQENPLAAIEAVHRGAPSASLIVDPNQAWTVAMFQDLAPQLLNLGVVLLEQPIKVGAEVDLDGYRCPIRLCADELVNDAGDLGKARGRFDVINIKLDKVGGLTAGLELAQIARGQGFDLMVGCMAGSSLSMAPATVLAQLCNFVDLDGPLLQSEDWPDGLLYTNGVIQPPSPAFWG